MPEDHIEPEDGKPALEITVKASDVKVEFPSGRKKTAYSLFLGKCLPKKPSDVLVSDYLGICSGLWKDIPDDEKSTYQKLADSLNEQEEENEEPK